jgi:hypothetical protein
MQWQALLKKICPSWRLLDTNEKRTKREFKVKFGLSHASLFGRYFHFWSMESVLQFRLQSLRCTVAERHEAFFAVMNPILHGTSAHREDQDYLLLAAERQQMEGIFGELFHNQRSHEKEASLISKAFDSRSKVDDITLTHEEVASDDYLVFCCIFADYMGNAWMEVNAGSTMREVGLHGRKVRKVTLHIGAAGGDESPLVFCDVWDNVASMKRKLRIQMQTHLESGEVPGWERGGMLTAMRESKGLAKWLPESEQGGDEVMGGEDEGGVRW